MPLRAPSLVENNCFGVSGFIALWHGWEAENVHVSFAGRAMHSSLIIHKTPVLRKCNTFQASLIANSYVRLMVVERNGSHVEHLELLAPLAQTSDG